MFPSTVAGLEEGESHERRTRAWTPQERRPSDPLNMGRLGAGGAICRRSFSWAAW